jgi:hypothetical protein
MKSCNESPITEGYGRMLTSAVLPNAAVQATLAVYT